MGMQQPKAKAAPYGHAAAKAKACSSQGLPRQPPMRQPPMGTQPRPRACSSQGLGSPPAKAKACSSQGLGSSPWASMQPRPRQPPMGMQQPRPRQPPKCMQQPRQPPPWAHSQAKLSSSQGLGKDGHRGVVVSLRRERGKEIIFFLGGIFF